MTQADYARRYREANPELVRLQRRASVLKTSYGWSFVQLLAQWQFQGGKCAICKNSLGQWRGPRGYAVDHCHRTGKVRGLLCGPCNQAIGLLGDDPERLRAAAHYVEV